MDEGTFDFEPLKQKLLDSDDLSEIMSYFFDHYASKPAFLNSGGPVEEAWLVELISQAAARSLLNDPTFKSELKGTSEVPVYAEMTLIKVGEQFYHGPGMLHGHILTAFYFDDVKRGLGCLSVLGAKEHFFRFSMLQMPPNTQNQEQN